MNIIFHYHLKFSFSTYTAITVVISRHYFSFKMKHETCVTVILDSYFVQISIQKFLISKKAKTTKKKERKKANYYLCKELYKLLSVGFEGGRTPRHNILYSNSCNIIHRKSNISSANPDTST